MDGPWGPGTHDRDVVVRGRCDLRGAVAPEVHCPVAGHGKAPSPIHRERGARVRILIRGDVEERSGFRCKSPTEIQAAVDLCLDFATLVGFLKS